MDQASYERITAILTRVLETPPELREELMVESCGGDSALLDSVREMLALAHADGGIFSDESVAERRAEIDELIDEVQHETHEWMPERIGSYAIEEVIGRGGTGVVFKAKQERPARFVAIKLLHPAFASEKTILRLAREAEFLGKLQHVGIAQIFEAGLFDVGAGEQPFLAMEWIRGRDLLAYAQSEKLDTKSRIELLSRVVEAVSHAHQNGVTHRDLKPDNILVATETGQPKLLDFGIAAMEERASTVEATMEGDLLGTIAYMAPEQARRSIGTVGAHTDVYSLGAIAFELIAHRPLRQVAGLTMTQAVSDVAERDAPRLRALGAGVPRDLAIIVDKALERSPKDRYASATELGADLRRFIEGRPILAKPPSWLDRCIKFAKRHRILVAGAFGTALMFTLGLVATIHQARLAGAAEDAARRELYAAQMVLATSQVEDPAKSSQIADTVARWRAESESTTAAGRPGWEWLLLDSVRRDRVVELELASSPLPIAWDPSGTRIAVGFSGAMAVHDAGTGEELQRVEVPDSEGVTPSYQLLTSLSWDPHRPNTVLGSGVGIITAWDLSSNELTWKVHPEYSAAVAPLRDGRVLAFDDDQWIHVHNGDTGEFLERWPERYAPLASLEVHGPTQRLLVSQRDDSSFIVDLRSMKPLPGRIGGQYYPTSLRWRPDGQRFAASFEDRVSIVQVDPWEVLFELNAHREKVFSADWSADGTLLASASADRTVRIHGGASGRLLHSFVGHQRVVRDARFSPSDHRIASVGSDGKVFVWDAEEADAIQVREADAFKTDAIGPQLEWKAERGTLAVMNRRKLVEWRVDASIEEAKRTEVDGAYVSSDGAWIFVHGSAGTHQIQDRQGNVAISFDNPSFDTFLCGAWHPTEPQFLAAVYGGVYLFQMDQGAEGQPRRISSLSAQTGHVEWSRDGQSAAIATYERTVKGFRLPSGEALFEFETESPVGVESMDWSPDGDWVVIGGSDGELRVRSTRGDDVSGGLQSTLSGHSREIDGLAWHPDGSRIASASRDGTVKLWDPVTGHMVGSFECLGRPSDVIWIKDGAALVAVDTEGRLYMFDASRGIARDESENR